MYKILVVDDDPYFRSAVARVLQLASFDVVEASDGEQAMRLLRDQAVDLTIVDIFMPKVDGMEFIIRVRRHIPDAKIIGMSGGGTVAKGDVLEIARRFGADRTLAKPFEMSELLLLVRDILGLPGSFDDAVTRGTGNICREL